MISLIITLVTLFFMGKTFEKMGRSFWQGFIPIYNLYCWKNSANRCGGSYCCSSL